MKFFLCSFGTPTFAFNLELLRHLALATGKVDHVILYDTDHPVIQAFADEHPEFLNHPRGFMLYAWKPRIIHHTMQTYMEDGDVLIYADAGTKVNEIPQQYVDALGDKSIVLFRVSDTSEHLGKMYCKQDCFEAMGCTANKYKDAPQVTGHVQMFRKGAESMRFVEEWMSYCSIIECMDEKSRSPNDPTFVAHRHDQSVLSNLSVKYTSNIWVQGAPSPDVVTHYRAQVDPFPKTLVITPTVGTAYLRRCIASVQAQTQWGVEHLVVVDGPKYASLVQDIVKEFDLKKPIHVMVLPFNTGKGGWNGHRIYASMPFLVDFENVAFLDEDNWYDPDHIKNLRAAMDQDPQVEWAFSLRKIVDADGNFVMNDNCESLGTLCHTILAWEDFLVDTSCYLLKTKLAQAAAMQWMRKARPENDMEVDRALVKTLMTRPHKAVAKHSVNYTASSSNASVTADFFIKGNNVLRYDFATKPTLYIFHFNSEKTQQFLLCMHKRDRSYALDEWQMTLLRGLIPFYNLVNGYAMEALIPGGALVYVSLCHMHDLPIKTLHRKDVRKILYTIESPNIRHQAQWNLGFLRQHFDHLLTYWEPLLQDNTWTTFCPANCHHLSFDNEMDLALLHTPTKTVDRDVVIVLECRDLSGNYAINGVNLTCLDHLRKHYVKDLTDITAYGMGWSQKINPRLKIGHTKHRSLDERSSIDIMKDFTFVLILENVNADGYVSEKIYDALIAGCIPIYFGNNNPNVGIPEDVYIDLKKFNTSRDLQNFLDSLSLEDIEAMRQVVLRKRNQVLAGVSTRAFAEAFSRAAKKTI